MFPTCGDLTLDEAIRVVSTRHKTQVAKTRKSVPKFGGTVRQHRERKERSLRDVARCIGVSNAYLSFVERDLERPSERVVLALARELDADSDDYLELAGRASTGVLSYILRDGVSRALRDAMNNDVRPADVAEAIRQLRKSA